VKELGRQTGDEEYKNLALYLVDQVHQVLGRHREDDTRTGWISGLSQFRELGLSIGLRALQRLQELIEGHPKLFAKGHPVHGKIKSLLRYLPLAEGIERFWVDPASRKNETWRAHQEINMVMLATSLAPDGFLIIS
jgi:hypothetical protein